jgi:hypothetical protein
MRSLCTSEKKTISGRRQGFFSNCCKVLHYYLQISTVFSHHFDSKKLHIMLHDSNFQKEYTEDAGLFD